MVFETTFDRSLSMLSVVYALTAKYQVPGASASMTAEVISGLVTTTEFDRLFEDVP